MSGAQKFNFPYGEKWIDKLRIIEEGGYLDDMIIEYDEEEFETENNNDNRDN